MSFWIHFTLQSSGSVFALLWGVPFLVAGEGQSRQFASSLLTLQMVLALLWGLLLSVLVLAALWPWALGIILVGPWLGHASWHAYRGSVEWEEGPQEAVTLGSSN